MECHLSSLQTLLLEAAQSCLGRSLPLWRYPFGGRPRLRESPSPEPQCPAHPDLRYGGLRLSPIQRAHAR
eukprot:7408949-Alexandrium_andersonii.AAC.1